MWEWIGRERCGVQDWSGEQYVIKQGRVMSGTRAVRHGSKSYTPCLAKHVLDLQPLNVALRPFIHRREQHIGSSCLLIVGWSDVLAALTAQNSCVCSPSHIGLFAESRWAAQRTSTLGPEHKSVVPGDQTGVQFLHGCV